MKLRTLPVINAIGCLALTGLVVAQWRVERARDRDFAALRSSLTEARNQAAEEAKHRATLEHAVSVLKETIESAQQALESATASLAESTELNTRLQAELDAAHEQLTAWEAALKTRDERIQKLNTELTATRKRLEQAIARLKAAE